jgi:hypothetical protein
MPGSSQRLEFACVLYLRGDEQVTVTASIAPQRWPQQAPVIESMLSGLQFRQSR